MATVKQFKEVLEEMRSCYDYDDECTEMATMDQFSHDRNYLTLITRDKPTGVQITMEKRIETDPKTVPY